MVDIENLQVDLRVAKRRLTVANNELAEKQRRDNLQAEAGEVFSYWCHVCHPGSSRIVASEKRTKSVLGRLREMVKLGMTREDAVLKLKAAVDGAAVAATVGPTGVKYDDLELICRDAVNVDSFVARAQARGARPPLERCDHPLAAYLERLGYGRPRWDQQSRVWRYRCPACGWDKDAPDKRPLCIAPTGSLIVCDKCGATAGTLLGVLRRMVAEEMVA